MWSLGVIAYIMLSGEPPFFAETEATMFARIKQCEYSFKSKIWGQVSDEAKDFVGKLLVLDTNSRMSSSEAMQHPWVNNENNGAPIVLLDAAENIKKWNAQQKWIRSITKVRAALKFKKTNSVSD